MTQCLMIDPVITTDGLTYERAAIEEWLATHDTSPLTGEKLESKVLVPNVTVRGMSRAYAERTGSA